MNHRLHKFATIALSILMLLSIPLFSQAAAAYTSRLASSWKVITSPSPGQVTYLNSVATLSSSDVWAVGDSGSGGKQLTLIEHWNGKQWSIIHSPNPGGSKDNHDLYGIAAVSASDVWAVGDYGQNGINYSSLIERWNGSQWRIVPSPNPGSFDTLYGVTVLAANDVWAVGQYNDNSGLHPLIEHWNGSQWRVVPNAQHQSQASILVSLGAVSADDIWAVGYVVGQGGVTVIEHWNGTSWSIVPSPSPGSIYNTLQSVTAASANDVWAVGRYGSANVYPLMEHWNGSQWSLVSSPNPMTGYTRLDGITSISAKNIWAVGSYFNSSASQYQTLIEHWNGTQWSLVSSPNKGTLGTELLAISALSSHSMWAVGFYWNINPDYRSLTELYS